MNNEEAEDMTHEVACHGHDDVAGDSDDDDNEVAVVVEDVGNSRDDDTSD